MKDIYIVDTNIIIAYLKQDPSIKIVFDLLLEHKIQIKISVITEIELLSYPQLNNIEERAINRILDSLISIGVDSKVGRKAAQLRKNYNFKLGDSIIIATAIIEKNVLISRDRAFVRCKELKVQSLKDLEQLYDQSKEC